MSVAAWLFQPEIPRVPPRVFGVAGVGLGFLVFLAGSVLRPPLGGFLALVVLAVLGLSTALLIARPGIFLAVFLTYATVAPLLGRIVNLPLGWFKGSFFMVLLPLWVLSRVARKGRLPWADSCRVPLFIYSATVLLMGILACISLSRGTPLLQMLNELRGYLLYPPLLFIALEAASDMTTIRRFLWFVVALTCLVAVGAIAQSLARVEDILRLGLSLETGSVAYIAIDPISGRVFQRIFSILDDQSSVAAFSFVGIALCLYLLTSSSRWRTRGPGLLALGMNAYAMLLTYNMTIITGTALFILILVVRQRSARLLAVFLIVAAVITGLAWIRYGELIRNRFVTSFSVQAGVSTSLAARIEENRRAWQLLKGEPVLGLGLGSTANAGVYYRLGLRSNLAGGIPTDNFYMTTVLELGVIGLVAVILLHLLPLIGMRGLARSRDPSERTFATIIGSAVIVLVLMNFSNGLMNTNPTNLLYWSLAGMAFRRSADTAPFRGMGD